MNISLFLSLFIGLGVIYLILGFLVSKDIKTNDDYFLAGRKLGLWPLTFSLIATQVGGGMLLGTAQESYNVGYYGIFYTLGMSLGFLLLGFGFAAKLREFNVSTTAELFEKKYGSIFLKKVASFLSALSLGGILAGQVVALKSLLFGIGITSDLAIIAFWMFIVLYTVAGGLKAVVLTDIFQIIFIVSIFIGVFVYSIFLEPLSFFTVASALNKQSFFSSGGVTFLKTFPVLFTPILFSLIEQDLGQRFFAARKKSTAALSAIISSVFLLAFSFVPVYFGMKAKLLGVTVAAGASPLIPLLDGMVNDLVLALIVCGLAAAITSTSDSLLCAISSNVAQDFDFEFFKRFNRVKFSQAVTFITGITALFIGYFSTNIIQMLTQSYQILISCIFVPVFFAFFTEKLKKEAAIGSMIFGAIAFVGFRFYSPVIPKEVLILMISLAGYFIGSYYCRQKI